MRVVLLERGLPVQRLRGKCKKCKPDSFDCCCKRIIEQQADFKEQRSLVQEVIEAAGHLCIFLLKFHCELNFIEYFWGVVKKYLCEHCDYTFETLKKNMPEALDSVNMQTIRCWEHRMQRWMDAYRNGMETRAAQIHVRNYSSKKYKSHRRIPEQVARAFDQ
ncbi:hypothetical protein K443DRAFT_93855 [Laccaria amethystina LaAM-08-1]|uniref:Uncharacterized protein n=1 Tax=Laccaria amethystina LaAM-08-1 TaxID=1095629 RepID=A0A0C9XGN7_9AGAR|nr:hypothetical protein K443DRAFT_93855 [Laccaria amethystina LaAM-08-1]